MSQPILRLTISHLDRIRDHGERTFPEECCGFLFGTMNGDDYDVTHIQALDNEQSENRTRRFLISPEQFIAAEKHAAETRLDLIGFYHSHPDHPAIPSDFDRDHALPFYAYVILSVMNGKAETLRSWRLKDDRSGYDEDNVIYKI